ncbi:hypothetical protein K461DRAFT_276155 [Myriangium duriaei CBS 260.36]|uniref:S1 motif domain-containing protein n=1 Tax=Myriangium duriaei CBS 260.36 TaxID=1168546 RepID=A0A9P4MJ68_9PEZI|nr:hypothetical protein K461DRAFT_276155 [Myriangium duriaei CBS 260.36]
MDLDLTTTLPTTILTPGAPLTSDSQFMRGHGTFLPSSSCPSISSSLLGTLTRTNKLLSITPLSARYVPEIGDLVVGRVTEVQSRRWKLDVCAAQAANLPLSSINLPGGALRRRTGVDELAMRAYFEEGDVLLAEVQSLFGDGSAALHARSLKYGKLRNGVLVDVGSRRAGAGAGAVKRSNRHVFELSTRAGEVEVLVGVNGFVYVCMPAKVGGGMKQGAGMGVGGEMGEEAARAMYSTQNDEIPATLRREIGRVASCVKVLAAEGVRVDEEAIRRCYDAACEAELSAEVEGVAEGGAYLGGERGRAVVRAALQAKG